MGDADLAAVIRSTELAYLHVAPSGPDLVGAEVELVGLPDRERRLALALEPVADRYDYILIDCPPSLGLLTLNALTAADAVLDPAPVRVLRARGARAADADRSSGCAPG